MGQVRRMNQKLVNEQMNAYEKTGRWPTKIVGKLKEPLLIAHVDGDKVVSSGQVKGLFWKEDGRYTDIRTGQVIAITTNREQQKKVEDALMCVEPGYPLFLVLWNEEGDPCITFVEE